MPSETPHTQSLKRILISGGKNFIRNGSVSFATVLIMTVTLSIVSLLFFLSATFTHILSRIEDQVDINIYLITTASENEIFELRDKLIQLPEVAHVEYTSREDALSEFKERHATDQLTLQALEELGENPLGASLAVKAKSPEQYESIVNFLSDDAGLSLGLASIIDHINYYQNKVVIDRLTSATRATERIGSIIVALFVFASVVIVFASMRLAIYSARDEIAVMRLVGAHNMYIRGPFLVSGIIAGILSALLTLVLIYPAAWYAGQNFTRWLGDFNLFSYYLSHFPLLFLILVFSGALLGGLASFLAVRRYLRV